MATPKEILEQIASIVKGLSITQKILGIVVIAVVVGGLLTLTTASKETAYKVLFSGLTQEDAGEVVTKLKDQRIPYKLSEDGGAIMVPASQVYEIRLSLAGEGLPRGGGVGFEIFNETSFGQTDFVQRLNYQRALQGELARTIRTFQQVTEARVHIATPKESVFIEDEKPPTASISVRLRGREKLNQHEIQSIVNLVASAVPGLTTENITLVDTSGRLLYRKQGDGEGILTGNQLEYQIKIEDTMRQKVETMLEEVVGVNRVRARVTADVDFNKVERTEETFDPEAQVVRSEQMLTENDQRGGANAEGIPGVKGELATYAEEGGGGGAAAAGYNRNNVTRNYEISKQTKHVQDKGGAVKKLSIAVMVDGTYEKSVDKDGKTSLKYQARSPEEMQNLDKLVKNAIGYNEERGDQVEVASLPFALSSVPEPEVDSMEKWRAMTEWLAMPLVYLLVAFLVILFVVKPFLKLLAAKQMETRAGGIVSRLGGHGPAVGEGVVEEEDFTLAPRGLTDQERIYRLAQSDPDRAADLVRRWLREEA
ncbi:flagellar basal-body MS-ring/collar protein FliF [Thiovibrio frasassiensis]|uniref:Flagellar M-ring protein n=1 Tax=Thiovibrio frasassiensis TaxID=2984131 RepID=A0A9X4MJ90_9BACT|nr:flagellar basal-body MS-ring/collar protein FliF [Thiovibrio frasassiensis]MDG4477025.1 flagellar basal-body MS-ring/collar protein FliF [Thiovibrio frasassiensis]